MHAQSVNNRIAYYYDTHGYESLKDIASRENSGTDVILDILKCLDRTLMALDEYFLDRDGIVLESQYIMWDSDSRKAGFVYVPGETTPVNVKLQHLFEYYMEHMQSVIPEHSGYIRWNLPLNLRIYFDITVIIFIYKSAFHKIPSTYMQLSNYILCSINKPYKSRR